MQYLYIIVYFTLLAFALFLEKAKYGVHITPITFFVALWCIVGIFANSGLLGYYLPSALVNLCIISGNIIILTMWMLVTRTSKDMISAIREEVEDFDFSVTVLLLIEIALVIMILPSFRRSINILRNYSFIVLRSAGLYGVAEDGGYSDQLMSIFVRPGFTLISLMTVLSFFNPIEKKKKKLLVVLTVFNLIIYTLTTAGRILVVNTGIYVVIAAMIYSKGRIFRFLKERKNILIPLLVLIITVLYLQNLRSPDSSVLKTIYVYYCSGPSFLTQLLEVNSGKFAINHDFMFGAATFGFITNIVSYALIYITGKPQGSLYMLGSVLTNNNLRVGEHNSVNAMCTCYYDFLLDWGYAGIVIGPIVVGTIFYFVYKQAAKKHTWGSMCVLIYIMNIMIRTVFKWDLVSTEFTFVCIYIWILSHVTVGSKNKLR